MLKYIKISRNINYNKSGIQTLNTVDLLSTWPWNILLFQCIGFAYSEHGQVKARFWGKQSVFNTPKTAVEF